MNWRRFWRGHGLIAIGLLLGWLAAIAPAASAAPAGMFVGQVYSFGDNRGGQLGYETNVEAEEPNPFPTAVTIPGQADPVVQGATGGDQSLVVTQGGHLYAFGYNYYGQLGNETYVGGNGPHGWVTTPTPVVLPGQNGPVVQAAAGDDFSLAVTANGQLYAFGDNNFGDLGNETNILRSQPNPTPAQVTLPGENGPVVEAWAGGFHSLALTSSGQVYAFGGNDSGQLGREHDNPPREWANPTPTLVTLRGELGPVTQIAAGREFSLAVTESGQLYSWGENRYGQLGYAENSGPTNRPSENEHFTPTLVTLRGELGPVTQIAAGSEETLALTAGGQLYAFGLDRTGQLGNTRYGGEDGYETNSRPTLVDLSGIRGNIVRIDAGYHTSYLLTSTGRLYSFGLNYFGELGRTSNDLTTNPNPTPTLVSMPGGAPVGAIATGGGATHMLVTVGMLVATSSMPVATVGAHYESEVEVEGGEGPYEWSARGLPQGLSIDPATGTISGTPTDADCTQAHCHGSFNVTAVDASEREVSETVTLELASDVRSLNVTTSGDGAGEVASSPSGIEGCGTAGGVCKANYGANEPVTLTAQPAAGSVFAGWSGGGCSGTDSCQVTWGEDATVTARFTKVPPSSFSPEQKPELPGAGGPPGGTPLPSGLKISAVDRSGRGRFAVTVRGTIDGSAHGYVAVKVVGRARGKRSVATKRAPIVEGTWGTRLVLAGVAGKPPLDVSAAYAGDADLLASRVERTARVGWSA